MKIGKILCALAATCAVLSQCNSLPTGTSSPTPVTSPVPVNAEYYIGNINSLPSYHFLIRSQEDDDSVGSKKYGANLPSLGSHARWNVWSPDKGATYRISDPSRTRYLAIQKNGTVTINSRPDNSSVIRLEKCVDGGCEFVRECDKQSLYRLYVVYGQPNCRDSGLIRVYLRLELNENGTVTAKTRQFKWNRHSKVFQHNNNPSMLFFFCVSVEKTSPCNVDF